MKKINPPDKGLHGILRLHDVLRLIGVSRSTIYKWVGVGVFPPPVKLGARAVGWRQSDIYQWLAERH